MAEAAVKLADYLKYEYLTSEEFEINNFSFNFRM